MIYNGLQNNVSLSYFNWILKAKERNWDHALLKETMTKNITNLNENPLLTQISNPKKNKENHTKAHQSDYLNLKKNS